MKLTANLPEPEEFGFEIVTRPRPPAPGRPTQFQFSVLEPKSRRLVRDFEVVHERIFHLFVIAENLEFFAHEHPQQTRDGRFRFSMALPHPGGYRFVADCYPRGATPQFLVRTIYTAGARPAGLPALAADRRPKQADNLRVELATEPAEPIAGKETLLFFRLSPGDGVEQYLGAWGHLLAASHDLIDLMHDHPLYVTPGPQIQFNAIFPRAVPYRVWVQFQRLGVVNTVAFTLPVKALS